VGAVNLAHAAAAEQAEDAIALAEDDADREAVVVESGYSRLCPGGAVTIALAARLAPHCAQKRLSAAASVPHDGQRVDGMSVRVREFYIAKNATVCLEDEENVVNDSASGWRR
jgi:hypothetical protein